MALGIYVFFELLIAWVIESCWGRDTRRLCVSYRLGLHSCSLLKRPPFSPFLHSLYLE